MVTTLTSKQTSKKPRNITIAIIVFVVCVGALYVQNSPSRHDSVTENDLNYIRKQIGQYVFTNKTMPTMEQLNLSASLQKRAAERHYTLTFVADHSNRSTFFSQPTFDYKQCADFLTNTSDLSGDTNDTHHGYHLHHKGRHCFINYAILNDNRFKP